MNIDGSNLQQITDYQQIMGNIDPNTLIYNLTDEYVWGPRWSPDGTKLLFPYSFQVNDPTDSFSGYQPNASWRFRIIQVNADGSNPVTLLGPTVDGGYEFPQISPDGNKILFGDNPQDYGGIWDTSSFPLGGIVVMNASGTNATRITDFSIGRQYPDWQPIPYPPSYTPPGTNVDVQPVDTTTGTTPATLTFSSVTQAGDTTVTSSASGPPPTSGFQFGEPAIFYDISTTAIFSGPITLCFSWTEGQFENERDTTANQVCGQTTSLSLFAIFESAYTFSGFYSPVDNSPTLNLVKAGSAVPVKFSLGGNQGLSIFAPGYPASQSVQCDTSAPLSAIEETVTSGGSSLTYDPSSDLYTYVWKTDKNWANTCRRLVVTFNDGTVKAADFSFAK